MATYLQGLHLAVSLTLVFSFVFYQIEIIESTLLLTANLFLFLTIFMCYGLVSYLLFHSSPGYQDPKSCSQIGVQNVFDYQSNQLRRQTIKRQLQTRGLAEVYLLELQEQLIFLYARTSFCNECRYVMKPRTHHCAICERCVLRKQFHSKALGMCIGQRNLKVYVQYLLVVLALGIYVSSSCMFSISVYSDKINQWPLKNKIFYALICTFGVLLSILLTGHLWAINKRLRSNITVEEAKIESFWKKNPFQEENYHQKLFPSWKDYLDINYKNQDFQMQMASSDRLPTLNY